MVWFHVQNMGEIWRILNRDLFTDNISKLGQVAKQSCATQVLHEYETECDSLTSYILHHCLHKLSMKYLMLQARFCTYMKYTY